MTNYGTDYWNSFIQIFTISYLLQYMYCPLVWFSCVAVRTAMDWRWIMIRVPDVFSLDEILGCPAPLITVLIGMRLDLIYKGQFSGYI